MILCSPIHPCYDRAMLRAYITLGLITLSALSFYSKSNAQSHEKVQKAKQEKNQKPRFIFPVICTLGHDCWAVNYVDTDPGDAVRDFRCTSKSYNDHKGTDFGLRSITQMNEGIDVIAAANGTVVRLRDGENDALKSEQEMEAIKQARKECGNAVLIDHGHGLQTIYCHLKQGSIAVRLNDKISAGEKIGQVGQSGLAQFPHLHFGVIWEGAIIDPFTGQTNRQDCDAEETPMWHGAVHVKYQPVAIFDGGFRNTPPDFNAIQRGEDNPKTISKNSAVFTFWAGFYNVEEGDKITLQITDPNDEEFIISRQDVTKTRTRQYYFTGRKIGRIQLIDGTYIGTVKVERKSKSSQKPLILERIFKVEVK